MEFFQIDSHRLLVNSAKPTIVFPLPIFIAWNREVISHSTRLGTFLLALIAVCYLTMLIMAIFAESGAQSKVIAGIVIDIVSLEHVLLLGLVIFLFFKVLEQFKHELVST